MLNMAALQVGAVEAGVRFYCLRWQYNANDRVGVSVGKSARSLSSSVNCLAGQELLQLYLGYRLEVLVV